MKKSLSIIIAALALGAPGCSTPKSTSLLVGGPAGTLFTVNYKAGTFSGTVSSTTKAGPSSVLAIDVRGKDFECDIAKGDRAADLSAELVQGGKPVFRAEAAAGTQGVRISHTETGWRQVTY